MFSVFIDKTSKVILFLKINLFIRSNTGLDAHMFDIKKMLKKNYIKI